VVRKSSLTLSVPKFAMCLLLALATAQAALRVPNFTPQQRVGTTPVISGSPRWPPTGMAISIFFFLNMAR